MNWTHILAQLIWGYHHLTPGHGLYGYYLRHHAIGFLNSGRTSGSGGRAYLHWLTFRRISPTDW